jgi:hypothetical protein
MMLAPYTSTGWQWISAGDVPFSRRNLVTLHTSIFDHVSTSPAILQLMFGQYDWQYPWEEAVLYLLWPGRKFEWNKEHYTRERSWYLIYWIALVTACFPWYVKDCIENDDVLNDSSILACVFVGAVMFLPRHWLAMIRRFLEPLPSNDRGLHK